MLQRLHTVAMYMGVCQYSLSPPVVRLSAIFLMSMFLSTTFCVWAVEMGRAERRAQHGMMEVVCASSAHQSGVT